MFKSICKYIAPLIKFSILAYLVWNYSYLGVIYFIFGIYSVFYLFEKLFGLNMLVPGDYQFIDSIKYQAVYILHLESLNKNNQIKIIEDLIEKAIKVYPRLKQKLTHFYINWFWQRRNIHSYTQSYQK